MTASPVADQSFSAVRGTARATSRRRSAHAGAIERTAENLTARAFEFERRHDPRCVFATAYSHLSRRLASALEGPSFSEPAWVAELTTVFADYYFHASDAFDSGTLAPGVWKSAFEAGKAGHTTVLQDLVLGMTAHIVSDLPHALCDVGLRDATGRSRMPDYHHVNDVLAAAIEEVQSVISHRYDPLLGALDLLAGHGDEILTDYGLRLSRALAWYNAERLLAPKLRATTEASLERSTKLVVRDLVDPPWLSLRRVARGVGCVSRAARLWPARDTDAEESP